MIRKAYRHFLTVIRHKYFVMRECFNLGLYWQGIIHDLSKFSYIEFIESVKHYTGNSSPIDEAKKNNGYSEAWLHHSGRNKHHWQYWVDFKDGNPFPIEIPDKYVKEIYCDMVGASKSYGTNNPYEYFKKTSKNWIITDSVREKLEKLFNK
jgi:hypothetical protein